MIVLSKTILLSVFILHIVCEKIPYDTYRGCPISEAELNETIKKNNTFWCVAVIDPCDPDEGRRVDGSCNNLDNPVRGVAHTPFIRLLSADYNTDDGNFENRKASDGCALPPVRYLRTSFIADGKVPDPLFTQLVTHFAVFFVHDIVTVQDTVNYVVGHPHCCDPKGKADPVCIPIEIPVDDPVHRFSGHRCLNMTRPISFQSVGCVKNDTVPERILTATPTMDLSQLYGVSDEILEKKGRLFEGGLLKYEMENGRMWPPSTKTKYDICLLNQKPAEMRCHDTPEDGANGIFGENIFTIWFWRNHNEIANTLAQLNSCWDDDMLFNTARDINIATYMQILYYEFFPPLMGKRNLLKDNLIMSRPGFRSLYNEQILPLLSVESTLALRWFHNMQEGGLKMYDPNGYYLREFPVVNLTFRTGFMAVDNNIDYLTQGSFRQPCAKADYVVDPEMSQNGLGGLQSVNDILTSDLIKSRAFGFQPYVNYRKWCFGKTYKDFDDLKDSFDYETLYMLRDRYKKVEDIDLMAGIMLERHVAGGHVPETLYCIVADQLRRFLVSDRHWYESPDRPYAFTSDQLAQIRKASISRLLCDVGDKVTKIQPNGFLRAGCRNRMRSCEEIQGIDYSYWKDLSCCGDNSKKKVKDDAKSRRRRFSVE